MRQGWLRRWWVRRLPGEPEAAQEEADRLLREARAQRRLVDRTARRLQSMSDDEFAAWMTQALRRRRA